MALRGLKQPWHSYDEAHMNEHMADHSVGSKKFAFTGYDLEMTYLLWHTTSDFQTVCQNRIIKLLRYEWIDIERELWEVHWFDNIHDQTPVPWLALKYQAQNLVYMYALWLVDTLDTELCRMTEDADVYNNCRHEGDRLDGIIPIFQSVIWMKGEIRLSDAWEVRAEYIEKRWLAREIREAAMEFGLKLNDTTLERERIRV